MAQAMDWAEGAGSGRVSFAGLGLSIRRHWRLAIFAVLLAAVGTGAGWMAHGPRRLAAVVAPYPHDLAEVKFAVAGDVIPHEAVRRRRVPWRRAIRPIRWGGALCSRMWRMCLSGRTSGL